MNMVCLFGNRERVGEDKDCFGIITLMSKYLTGFIIRNSLSLLRKNLGF